MAAPVLDAVRYDTDDGLPIESGCVSLVVAFWERVRKDLQEGDLGTLLWVDADGEGANTFAHWCHRTSGNVDVSAARAAMLAVWRAAVNPQPQRVTDPVTQEEHWYTAPAVIPKDVPLVEAAPYFGKTELELRADHSVKTIRRLVPDGKDKETGHTKFVARWFVSGAWLWQIYQTLSEAPDGPPDQVH